MLRAAFDACAETVGMELEAANKTITLRFVTRDGRERKLNTKSSWEELREARCVMIRLQSQSWRMPRADASSPPRLGREASRGLSRHRG